MNDRKSVVEIRIVVHEDGALAVYGPVDDTNWCIAALENAKDAVRSHSRNKRDKLIVPSRDVSLP